MENNLKKLPPLERKPDGSLHRMTPAQRKRANALIRRECCNLSCRWIGRWKQRFSGIRTQNGVLSAGELLFPALTGRNTARIVPPAFTGGRKQKVNGKGGRAWTIRGEKSLYLWGFLNTKPGQVVFFIANPQNRASNCP